MKHLYPFITSLRTSVISNRWLGCYILFFAITTLSFSACKKEDSLTKEVQTKVQTLREESELTTVEYTINKVIKASDDAWYKIGERKILFTCSAYLKAGVDLSNMSMESIQINEDEKTITINLPHAELQSINIPPDKIQAVYQKVGVLRSNFTAAERNALVKQGQQDIINNIHDMGILEDAEQNAVNFFTDTFTQLGFNKVIVKFYPKNETNKL